MKLKARIIVGFTMIILVPLLLFAAALYGLERLSPSKPLPRQRLTVMEKYMILPFRSPMKDMPGSI